MILLAFMITACGGGSTSSVVNAIDDVNDDSGFANITFDNDSNLVFNIPSPVNLIRNNGNSFPALPFNIHFTLVDIFEDLPLPPSLA